MASVTLRQLTKTFDSTGHPALRDVSLTVPDGEFLVVLGPSGCGKTTALRCIAGLEEPTAGEILIGDRVVTHDAPAARDVAMVFQNYALYPHLTVRQNIAFALEMRRVPAREILRRVAEASDRLGLGELLERRPAQLSSGQRQRVGPSCARRRCSSSTSRSRTSTPSCGRRCGPSSSNSTASSGPP